MPALGDWIRNSDGDFWLRGQVPVIGANVYIALFTLDPTPAGTGNELSGNGYARVPVVRDLENWAGTQGPGTTAKSTGTTGTFSNNVPIVFPAATNAWPTATHWGMFESVTGGNLMYFGPLDSSITAAVNDVIDFPPGYLQIVVQ